ncbi:MAG: ABC transporter permease, partial [Spirochaetales bacterium]|nr:ABC transporter permease [Spirochaetales bacterium]
MKNNYIRFIATVALRYFRNKRKSSRISSATLSIMGITVGVMTLVCVLGVMNGFQLSFIEPILNVNSYHIQIQGVLLSGDTVNRIKVLPGVEAIVPFTENQAIIKGSRICVVRGIDPGILQKDITFKKSFKDRLFDIPGDSNLVEPDSIVVGNQLAYQLNMRKGDTIPLLTITGTPLKEKTITGIFKTGYYDLDLGWAFVPLDSTKNTPLIYGVKLKDRFNDEAVMAGITAILDNPEASVKSWREFNRNFFAALLMEKIMMMVLVGLIFIVVGFNIFHSMKRTVFEKMEEIATLKALGAPPFSIRNIFIFEGIITGVLGCTIGTFAG